MEEIVQEKRLQWKGRNAPEISLRLSPATRNAQARLDRIELTRVLSNLIDNAIEATKEDGRVAIELQVREAFADITITDNGRGIPKTILDKLGREHISFGKENDTSVHGRGVYHAFRTVEGWGGTLVVNSTEGQGTQISIQLPLAV